MDPHDALSKIRLGTHKVEDGILIGTGTPNLTSGDSKKVIYGYAPTPEQKAEKIKQAEEFDKKFLLIDDTGHCGEYILITMRELVGTRNQVFSGKLERHEPHGIHISHAKFQVMQANVVGYKTLPGTGRVFIPMWQIISWQVLEEVNETKAVNAAAIEGE